MLRMPKDMFQKEKKKLCLFRYLPLHWNSAKITVHRCAMRFFPSVTTTTSTTTITTITATTTITTSTTSTTVSITSAIITTIITTLPSSPSPTITNYQPTTNRPTTGYCDLLSSTLRLSFNSGNDDTHRVNSTVTKFATVRKTLFTAWLPS
jgi:hypothetical protein